MYHYVSVTSIADLQAQVIASLTRQKVRHFPDLPLSIGSISFIPPIVSIFSTNMNSHINEQKWTINATNSHFYYFARFTQRQGMAIAATTAQLNCQ